MPRQERGCRTFPEVTHPRHRIPVLVIVVVLLVVFPFAAKAAGLAETLPMLTVLVAAVGYLSHGRMEGNPE